MHGIALQRAIHDAMHRPAPGAVWPPQDWSGWASGGRRRLTLLANPSTLASRRGYTLPCVPLVQRVEVVDTGQLGA